LHRPGLRPARQVAWRAARRPVVASPVVESAVAAAPEANLLGHLALHRPALRPALQVAWSAARRQVAWRAARRPVVASLLLESSVGQAREANPPDPLLWLHPALQVAWTAAWCRVVRSLLELWDDPTTVANLRRARADRALQVAWTAAWCRV